MELQKYGAEADEARNGDDTEGCRRLPFDIDLALRDVIEKGQGLTIARHVVSQLLARPRPGRGGQSSLTVAIETQAGRSMRGSCDAPERKRTHEQM